MIIRKYWLCFFSVIALILPLTVVGKPQKSDYRQADANEIRNYTLSMEKIRKLGEVEKAVWQLLDKNAEMSNAWNDHGIGAQGSIAAGVAVTEKEFPQIAEAIHKAGFSTREYVVCYLTEQKTLSAVVLKMTGKQKEYPPYVNPANATLIEQHFDEIRNIMNQR